MSCCPKAPATPQVGSIKNNERLTKRWELFWARQNAQNLINIKQN